VTTSTAAPTGVPPADSSVIAGAVVGLGRSEVARRELSDGDIAALVRRQVDDRDDAANEYERLGQADAAATMRAEAAALRIYIAD
jgi:uncharacterized protein YqeY